MLSARLYSSRCSARSFATQAAQTAHATSSIVQQEQKAPKEQAQRKKTQPSTILNEIRSNIMKQLDSDLSSKKILAEFQSSIQAMIKEQKMNPQRFSNSSICTSVLTKLIEQSKHELDGKSIGELAMLPPAPFEILQIYLKYNLARHEHFQLVLKHFLSDMQPQEAINLWITFLESSKNLPLNNTAASHIKSYTSVAYLMLCQQSNEKVSIDVLSQLLNTPVEKIPFQSIASSINSLELPDATKAELETSSLALLSDLMIEKKTYFISNVLQNSNDIKLIQFFWDKYLKIGKMDFSSNDLSLPAAFMVRFAQLGRSNVSLKALNQLKEAYPEFESNFQVNNALLKVVAYMPSFGKNSGKTKVERIQAIWNSFIKSNSPIEPSSYVAMIEALIIARQFSTLESFWKLDVPEDIKQLPAVSESYLLNLFSNFKNSTYANLKSKIPEDVTNLDLANGILLFMVRRSAPYEDIESFYSRVFMKPGALRPSHKTLATKMYGDLLNRKEGNQTKLLNGVGISNNSENEVPVIEEFLKIVQNDEAIEELYGEIDFKSNNRNNALKFSKFLDCYFENGKWQMAEKIFKEFLTNHVKNPTLVNHKIFNSIFKGFSELGVKENEPGFLAKEQVYWELCERIHGKVFNEAVISTLKLVSELSRRKTKLEDSQVEFINDIVLPYLVKLRIENGFRVQNERILENIKVNDTVKIPKELL